MIAQVDQTSNQTWSSRWTFMLAAIGFSVGLGNIWRFPYLAGENGGGAFILIYALSVILIGIPIIIAELSLGRMGGGSPPASMRRVARRTQSSPRWSLVGSLGVLSAFLIASFYCVIGGWTFYFSWLSASGTLTGLSAQENSQLFDALLANPLQLMFWQGLFVIANILAIGPGLRGGIERVVVILMPVLFMLLAGLALAGLLVGARQESLAFLFKIDFSVVSSRTWLDAMGQAFFSVGVGLGAMLTYGASLPKSVNLPFTATTIAFADTAVAIVAGLAIFPFVFELGQTPAEGPGLVFVALPTALLELGGPLLALSFFALLSIAALTSSIAVFHMVTTRVEEYQIGRKTAALGLGVALWGAGLLTVFSFNYLSSFYPLSFLPGYEEATIFGSIDRLTATLTLPLSGILIAWFVGHRVGRDRLSDDLRLAKTGRVSRWLHFFLSWPIPVTIAIILVAGLTL